MATPATKETSLHGTDGGANADPVLLETPGPSSARQLDGKGLRMAIVSSRWYGKEVVEPLVNACKDELLEKGVAASDLVRIQVAGAYEIPFAAGRVIQTHKQRPLDAIICIGCMVKGATMAYEFVSEAVTMAIMKLNVKTDTPVVFGVLTCASEDEAKKCASKMGECGTAQQATGRRKCNHGVEWAQSALEMAHLRRSIAHQIATKCLCKCHCKSEDCRCSCHCKQCKCETCTCEDDCKCATCGGKSATKQQHASTTCTSCGQTSSKKCDCKDCNCHSCTHKQQQQHGKASVCAGCGQTSDKCYCEGCNCHACAQKQRMSGAKSP
uniref:6,7-dimethyl-8-ribityllumazine synthase n=1 Tax=Globisporangium ultimum (strain ATCC 200006 / CBS 805.95 / DAOM BR144) TaxID=431595 RepID=K3X573_GLOUD